MGRSHSGRGARGIRAWKVVALSVALAAPITAQDAPEAQPPAEQPRPQLPQTEGARFSRTAEAEIRFQEGLLLYNRGQLAAAEKAFTEVIESDPADAEAYYYLGLAQLDQHRPAVAVENFDQAIRLDPTFDEVRAARATALIRLRRFDAAREDLEVLRPDPRWESLYHYLMGQLLYLEGDLEGAAGHFAAARAAGGTEAAPAEFYEGLTYLRMRELVRARETFREAGLGGAERDPAVAAASRQLDAALAQQERRRKPWEIQLTAGIEYDSNAILLGTGMPTPGEISDEEDWRWVLQPRGSYTFYRSGPFSAGVEGSGYFTFYDELTDFNVQSVQGGPFMQYRITDRLTLSGRYAFNYIEFGHESFLARHLITPMVTLVQPDFGYTALFYQYQHRDFKTEPIRPEFNRDGHNHVLGVVQGINLPELFEGAGASNLELFYRYDRQITDGNDFDAHLHTLGTVLYVPLPIPRTRADAGVSVSFDRYKNPNSVDNNPAVLEPDIDSRRRDFQLSVTTGITHRINDNLAARVDYTYTDRDSNIETTAGQRPYEYDRHQVGVRLILSY